MKISTAAGWVATFLLLLSVATPGDLGNPAKMHLLILATFFMAQAAYLRSGENGGPS